MMNRVSEAEASKGLLNRKDYFQGNLEFRRLLRPWSGGIGSRIRFNSRTVYQRYQRYILVPCSPRSFLRYS